MQYIKKKGKQCISGHFTNAFTDGFILFHFILQFRQYYSLLLLIYILLFS